MVQLGFGTPACYYLSRPLCDPDQLQLLLRGRIPISLTSTWGPRAVAGGKCRSLGDGWLDSLFLETSLSHHELGDLSERPHILSLLVWLAWGPLIFLPPFSGSLLLHLCVTCYFLLRKLPSPTRHIPAFLSLSLFQSPNISHIHSSSIANVSDLAQAVIICWTVTIIAN